MGAYPQSSSCVPLSPDIVDAPGLDTLVARQPVFDRKGDVFAYELLFRQPGDDVARIRDASEATATVILRGFVDIGLVQITDSRPVFVNTPRPFLVGDIPIPVPKERIILEVQEGITPDAQVLDGMRRLSAQGYRLALDNYVHSPEKAGMVQLADFVKLDVSQLGPDGLREHVAHLRRVELVGQRVETEEQASLCRRLGIDLYQGYFFARPQVVRRKGVGSSRLGVLRLVKEVCSPETELTRLKSLVSQDVTMSYRLLKCVNSAAFARRRTIETVAHAVGMLGERRVRQWITLVALSQCDDASEELLVTAMTRAGMCELVGLRRGTELPCLFMVGLLSVLDRALSLPMAEILEDLPLSPLAREALLQRTGVAGQILKRVIAYENGRWAEARDPALSDRDLRETWVQAVGWAEQIRTSLTA